MNTKTIVFMLILVIFADQRAESALGKICTEPLYIYAGPSPEYPYYNNLESVVVDVVAVRVFSQINWTGVPYISSTKPAGYRQIGNPISDADLDQAMATLGSFYAEFDITINLFDTMYFGQEDAETDIFSDDVRDFSAGSNVITMMIGPTVLQDTLAWTGEAWTTPSKHFRVSGPRVFDSMSHELGHCLGLLHTFENRAPIIADFPGSGNCDTYGDQICDTPAAVDMQYPQFDYVDENCNLTPSFYAAFDSTWQPSTTNEMSYSRFECYDGFTVEQECRIFTSLDMDWNSIAAVVSDTTAKLTPNISPLAQYEVIIAGSDTTFVVFVEASHPNGYDLRVHFEAIAFGDTSNVFLLDDGVAPDLVDNDGIYTSAATVLELGGEVSFQIGVLAGAHIDDGGDHSFAEESVTVVPTVVFQAGVFVDKSSSTGDLSAVPELPTIGMPIDFDGDGFEDMLMGFAGSVGKIFRFNIASNSTPVFVDESGIRMVPGSGIPVGTTELTAMDFDGDGDDDMFACATPPKIFSWDETFGTQGGRFDDVTSDVLEFVPDHVFTAAWGDMEDDGWIDLAVVARFDSLVTGLSVALEDRVFLFRNYLGKLKYLGNLGLPGNEVNNLAGKNPFTILWSDINGDSNIDLLVSDSRVGNSGTILYKNDGFVLASNGTEFTDATALWFGTKIPSTVEKARFVDVDNDGIQELYIVDGSSDALELYRMESSKLELDINSTYSGLSVDQVALADFNLDGAIDALVTSSVGGETPKLLLNGAPYGLSPVIPIETGIPAGVASSAVGFDWSGGEPAVSLTKTPAGGTMSDFFYGYQQSPGANGPNKYIRLRIAPGGVVNSSGVGTRVEISYDIGTETFRQYQWVTSDGSAGIAQSKTLVFGLGDYSGSTVGYSIVWPHGGTSSADSLTLDYGSGGTLDNYVYTISNTESPAVIPNSDSAVYQIGTGGNNQVIFEWDSVILGDAMVSISPDTLSASGCACLTFPINSAELLEGQVDVQVIYSQTVANEYHTKVIWSGRCCEPSCTYIYTVYSRLNGSNGLGATGSFKTPKNCPVSN